MTIVTEQLSVINKEQKCGENSIGRGMNKKNQPVNIFM